MFEGILRIYTFVTAMIAGWCFTPIVVVDIVYIVRLVQYALR